MNIHITEEEKRRIDKNKRLLAASLLFVETAVLTLEKHSEGRFAGITDQWNEIKRDITREFRLSLT